MKSTSSCRRSQGPAGGGVTSSHPEKQWIMELGVTQKWSSQAAKQRKAAPDTDTRFCPRAADIQRDPSTLPEGLLLRWTGKRLTQNFGGGGDM